MNTTQFTEHEQRCEDIYQAKGAPNWDYLMPATKEEIINAQNSNKGLNAIPLAKWDGRAPNVGWTEEKEGKRYKSLSMQVCLLKHYARYHYANINA